MEKKQFSVFLILIKQGFDLRMTGMMELDCVKVILLIIINIIITVMPYLKLVGYFQLCQVTIFKDFLSVLVIRIFSIDNNRYS